MTTTTLLDRLDPETAAAITEWIAAVDRHPAGPHTRPLITEHGIEWSLYPIRADDTIDLPEPPIDAWLIGYRCTRRGEGGWVQTSATIAAVDLDSAIKHLTTRLDQRGLDLTEVQVTSLIPFWR